MMKKEEIHSETFYMMKFYLACFVNQKVRDKFYRLSGIVAA
jgi:hypothetical protein